MRVGWATGGTCNEGGDIDISLSGVFLRRSRLVLGAVWFFSHMFYFSTAL
jgi:hypothetical protein